MEYYGNIRTEMLEFVPDNAKIFLEVGCGEGRFSSAIKQRNTAKEAWGVELFPEAAKVAEKALDKVLCGDYLSSAHLLPNNNFDVVIFNDVLEHFENPWAVLENVKTKLNSSGVVVASIPNVAYITNLVELILKKDWRYKPEGGILDKTHLRFFTKKSAIRLFEESGYIVTEIKGINPIKHFVVSIANIVTLGFFSESKYLQFAVVAKVK